MCCIQIKYSIHQLLAITPIRSEITQIKIENSMSQIVIHNDTIYLVWQVIQEKELLDKIRQVLRMLSHY